MFALKRLSASIELIKTRNRFIEMLTYLVEYGFYFTEVVPCSNIEDNRILLEKCL